MFWFFFDPLWGALFWMQKCQSPPVHLYQKETRVGLCISELRRAEEMAFTKLKEKEAMNQKEIKRAEESMLRQEASLIRELAGLEERLLAFA